jgi:hypothetical protein
MMGCPPELRCPADSPVLQADGTCATELNDDLESPCEAHLLSRTFFFLLLF